MAPYFLLLIIVTPVLASKSETNSIINIGAEKLLLTLRALNHDFSPSDYTPIVSLLKFVVGKYFKCFPAVLYDEFYFSNDRFKIISSNFVSTVGKPVRLGQTTVAFGRIGIDVSMVKPREKECFDFIIFTKEVETVSDILTDGFKSLTKVVLIVQSSRWHIHEFLSGPQSRLFPNLLVIPDPITFRHGPANKNERDTDIRMYTHELFTDSMGESRPRTVTTWRGGRLLPQVDLFPNKFKKGFNGLQFVVSAAEQPPYVFIKKDQESSEGYAGSTWDGLEVRLLKVIAEKLNFTIDIKGPPESKNSGPERALKELRERRADMAIGAIYATEERNRHYLLTAPHSQDCAAFISLASIALPKYRAIMGPFLVDVWIALTFTYILAMFPIAFSVWHSIRPLLRDPVELENMFWYVFGTFTNCFTFTGANSWSRSRMSATRIFIGFYWVFTIIITAAYTGSIIAFITLPVFPNVIDTSRQLLNEKYQVITLDNGGWKELMNESEDPVAKQLYRGVSYVDDIGAGLNDVKHSLRSVRKSTYLGSRDHLEYIARTNFTSSSTNKRSLFHLSKECFVPLMVCITLPANTLYQEEINYALIRTVQTGFMNKIIRDVQWNVYRTSTGKLLQQSGVPLHITTEDRQLTLDDMQGTFLLLGAGFAIAFAALFLEIFHWVYVQIKRHQPPEPTLWERICDYCRAYSRRVYSLLLSPSNSYLTAEKLHYLKIIQDQQHTVWKHDELLAYFGSIVDAPFGSPEGHSYLEQNIVQNISIQSAKSMVMSTESIKVQKRSKSI